MSQVGGIGAIASGIDLGPAGSLQFQFAKLQLALAEFSKNNALEYMDQIQKSQDEQKAVNKMLQDARQAQANAAKLKEEGASVHWTPMTPEMVAYMDKHGLAYDKTGNDITHTKDEWEVAITSLKARLDSLGTDTQQKMVFVQDFMGQYNSYLQGANSAIQQSNQTLGDLARLR